MENKTIAQAKKNFHDYLIIEKFTAGLALTGNEIKSIRNHQTIISEAYVSAYCNELFIINMHIAAYQHSPIDLKKSFDPKRKRKLLLKKREIKKLIGKAKAKNYAIIPLRLFVNNRGWAKLEIALAQHLRKYQIKEKEKERELKKKLRTEEEYY